jgi:hypothetical protein
MKNLKYLLLLIFIPAGFIYAQHANFNTQRNWSLHKKELLFGLGATQFNGDLGGSYGVGRDYSLKDIDWPSTSMAGFVGFRYRFAPMFATTSSLSIFGLRGDDEHSEEPVRNARSLQFKSLCFEVSQRLEFIVYANEKFGSTFNLPGNYSKKNRSQQLYGFGGIGLLYFNPKAQNQDGDWTALRPLKTEGQAKSYSPLTFTMPVGVGFRWGLGNIWRMGVEVSYVKTFSDYIDDVSTTYADPASFTSADAAYLSNPAVGNPSFAPGEQRGDPRQKDAYYHLNVFVSKNITYKDYGKQRKKYNLKSTGKFRV